MRAGLKGTVLNMLPTVMKGIVHPKISFLSLFIHSHVVPNLQFIDFFLVLHTKEDILKNLDNQTVAGPH